MIRIALALTLLAIGWTAAAPTSSGPLWDDPPLPSALVSPDYSYDPRTGMCFASYRAGHSRGFTVVPCSDEVLELADPRRHGG